MRVKMNKPEDLCLLCGMCCNGVIFADVQLQPADDAARLKALGIPLLPQRGKFRFTQPCAAFGNCACRIYPDRPDHCRAFECVLLKSVKSGGTDRAAAERVIRTARQRAAKVLRILRELGNRDEDVSLGARFRATAKAFNEGAPDEASADLFGDLTLAMHDLNLLLSEAFFPGPQD
jgi:Fe-S-cluster containining protein